jgi:hypothetical protein
MPPKAKPPRWRTWNAWVVIERKTGRYCSGFVIYHKGEKRKLGKDEYAALTKAYDKAHMVAHPDFHAVRRAVITLVAKKTAGRKSRRSTLAR